MKVSAVVVTYGNRFNFLFKVVEKLIDEEVESIVIINNGSVSESSEKINGLREKYPTKVRVFNFLKNEGSAKGFKRGIEIAYELENEFIWILDDDNIPVQGSLQELKKNWLKLEKYKIKALCSFRKDRKNYYEAIIRKDPFLVLQPKNNYAGFHIKYLFSKIKERFYKETIVLEKLQNSELAAAAYGGLFFNKKLIDQIGFPDEKYFLYYDDFDFTFRFYKSGGKIFVIPDSIVEDIDTSLYLPKRKSFLYHSVFDSANESQVYYAFRNSFYFSHKNLIENKLIYLINKFFFWSSMFVMSLLRTKSNKLKILTNAIRDARDEKLGLNMKYKI